MKVYWGWVVCLLFLLLFTLCVGLNFSYSELIVPLSKDIHESLGLLGWVGAVPLSLPMLAAPIGTYMHFRFGCRRTVMLGVLITSLGFALSGLVHNVGLLFLCYGILGGFGIMMQVNPPFFLLEEYFPYHHPRHVLATSIIACAFPLATLIFNPLTYAIMVHVGWRLTYSIYAVTMFVVGVPVTLAFRHKDKGETDSSVATGSLQQQYEELEEKVQSVLARRTKVIIGGLWLVASTMKSIGYYTPFVTLVKQMDTMGIPQSQAATAMTVVGACEVVSRVLASYGGDYIKGKILYVYVGFTLVLGLQNALATLAYTYTHLVIYAAALGILGGPIIAAMYSSCAEVMLGQEVPVLFSIFRVGLGIGALIGPTLAGAIFDLTNSFIGAFYVNAVAYFICSAMYACIIYLNIKKPLWCFPDVGEELALVNKLSSQPLPTYIRDGVKDPATPVHVDCTRQDAHNGSALIESSHTGTIIVSDQGETDNESDDT